MTLLATARAPREAEPSIRGSKFEATGGGRVQLLRGAGGGHPRPTFKGRTRPFFATCQRSACDGEPGAKPPVRLTPPAFPLLAAAHTQRVQRRPPTRSATDVDGVCSRCKGLGLGRHPFGASFAAAGPRERSALAQTGSGSLTNQAQSLQPGPEAALPNRSAPAKGRQGRAAQREAGGEEAPDSVPEAVGTTRGRPERWPATGSGLGLAFGN